MMIKAVTRLQICAAIRMHRHLGQWRLSDSALHSLREKMPGWNDEESLVKCVAINALYGTNVFAIVRMAMHVRSILEPLQGCYLDGLVGQISLLDLNDGKRPRQHVSFASKLCHFFVNEEHYPIYDNAARDALRYHLGNDYCGDRSEPYKAFQENLRRLRAASSIVTATGREMDRYLWIVGMYMRYDEWRRAGAKGRPIVNTELFQVFEQRPIPDDLDTLLPRGLTRFLGADHL
jgi:hypothetical protein